MAYKNVPRTNLSRSSRLRKLRAILPIVIAAVLLAAGGLALHAKRSSDAHTSEASKHATNIVTKPISDAKSQGKAVAATPSVVTPPVTPTPASGSDKSSTSTTVDTSTPLKAPTGEFVSAHQLPSGGEKQPQTSICNTTAGASCSIVFTQGATSHSLATKIADSEGAARWDDQDSWIPTNVGLTTGEWTVTAKATLGTQTAQTNDANKMVIQ